MTRDSVTLMSEEVLITVGPPAPPPTPGSPSVVGGRYDGPISRRDRRVDEVGPVRPRTVGHRRRTLVVLPPTSRRGSTVTPSPSGSRGHLGYPADLPRERRPRSQSSSGMEEDVFRDPE